MLPPSGQAIKIFKNLLRRVIGHDDSLFMKLRMYQNVTKSIQSNACARTSESERYSDEKPRYVAFM